ncbi:FAD/NAD(P)-binding protein [Desertibaculum subflavum]|uniref:FAD/NAD(P)-binding protein n=1 Tax=Desertibaculum subflavum TaxID=2268458 RepID=UPI0034D2DDA3
MLPRVGRVRARRRDAPLVFTLEIEPAEGSLPPFAPGQFNMLTVFGVGEVPISLSGDPARPGRLIHTVRAVGPVSTALSRLDRGDPVGLRGPFGTGWPVEQAAGSDVVVVAGGLGLAPLRPALYQLLAPRRRYGRIALLYGTRSPADILFAREIDAWRRRKDIEVHVTVDHATGDWPHQVGVVTSLISRARFDPARTTALVCGPEVMMRFAIGTLQGAGVASTQIYLSLERNMKCAIGLCGHCQMGAAFICRDGPVFRHDRVRDMLALREI